MVYKSSLQTYGVTNVEIQMKAVNEGSTGKKSENKHVVSHHEVGV